MSRELERIEVPDAEAARARAWEVVLGAYGEREPMPPPRARRTLVVALALVGVAAVLAVVTPPGRAVIERVREVVGVEHAQPALFSLPAPGRLLVTSDAGSWVVKADGSRRLLGGYREASWSPFGRFVVAARRNELAALEPDGDVRWTLARSGVRFPRWGGTETDTRIAYVDRSGIRVVAGDGTGDRLQIRGGTGPLAWRPHATHELASVSDRALSVLSADTGRVVWRVARGGTAPVLDLEWSTDGRRLLALTPWSLSVYDSRGRLISRHRAPGRSLVGAAFVPGTHTVATITRPGEVAAVSVAGRTIFTLAGDLRGLAWSPDGQRLLVGSPEADQWIFVRPETKRIVAVSNVSEQFRSRATPTIEGWCCSD